jgi:predicted dienelactone hydrolase
MKQTHTIQRHHTNRQRAYLAVALIFSVASLMPLRVLAQANGPAEADSSVEREETLVVHASRYTTHRFEWTDSQRNRKVPAKLYLPAVLKGAVPLVVFSHGIGGSRDGYSYLGQYLAAHGYASLHVQHVGSDRQVWFGNPFALVSRLNDAAQDSEALSRVLDLQFALDRLLSSKEGTQIDSRRIVAAGHSYGANTTMLIAGAQVEQQGAQMQLRDPRVSAAILISAPPFYGRGDPNKILNSIRIPTLHITATEDNIQIPGYFSGLQDRVDIFKAMGPQGRSAKILAVFKQGSHSMFTDRMGTGGVTLNPRVKIATRQLVLAFLDGMQSQNFSKMDLWPRSNADIVATFEKQVP